MDEDSEIKWMLANNIQKVAVQLPESLLSKSADIIQLLEDNLVRLLNKGREEVKKEYEFFVVLTASCGVDYLSPLRLGDKFIKGVIYIGTPCLTANVCYGEIPVFFNFGREKGFDNEQFVKDQISLTTGLEPLILYDLKHSLLVSQLLRLNHIKEENVGKITRMKDSWTFTPIIQNLIVDPQNQSGNANGSISRLGIFTLSKPLDSFSSIIWIGECSDLFYRVNGQKDITLINPETKTVSTVSPQKELIKRLSLIEKVKEAKTVGLIFSNVLPEPSGPNIDRLKKLLKKKKKEFLLISLIQAVDNSKFGNFGEVDAFVLLTACSCGSFILSTKAHVPLITEIELLISLGVKVKYGGLQWNAEEEQDEEEETEDIANEIKTLMEYKDNMKHHWFGLEVSAGDTPASEVKEGLTGIASAYDSEHF